MAQYVLTIKNNEGTQHLCFTLDENPKKDIYEIAQGWRESGYTIVAIEKVDSYA